MSGTNAPVSVHISYQCSIGPDSPIYDVAHTPTPTPMARKVTTRRPVDRLPPLPADDGEIHNAGRTPAPSPKAPHFPRAFPFDASVNAPGESTRSAVARSLTAPAEGMNDIRRRWAADAAIEAVRRQKQVASTSSEEDDCSHRRSQSARVSICVEDSANCLADPYEGVDSTARMRRRRNLARKGGSAHGLGKRSLGLSPASPAPRARSLLSVPGKAQPDTAHCSTDNATPASGDEDDPYMNLAQARGGGSRSDLTCGLGPKASPADVSSAAMGFSVCDDSGYGGESVEDTRGNFQTVAELPIPAWELPLPAPADDAEVPDWDSPLPAPAYKERLGMLARTQTVDSGYGDDPNPSRPTTPLSPDAAAPSQSVQLSLRSKNAGRSMVRRLGSLMGELAGELQSVRMQQSDVEA